MHGSVPQACVRISSSYTDCNASKLYTADNNLRNSEKMPIESFYEPMEIDTPEKVQRLVEAFEAAERRGPYVPTCDIMKVLEEGERDLERFIEEFRAEIKRSKSQ